MAEAKRLEEFNKIVLVLSPEEALLLVDISGFIGGPPDTSRRGLITSIREALLSCGVSSRFLKKWGGPVDDIEFQEGGVFFK